ncbi:MAG: VCBS repeat-containing protein [Planctomycetes bacterium]|nr:VCBS repeat-containing protein [Planctomycetota bacterium]
MIRLLTVCFVLLLGAVVYLRREPPAVQEAPDETSMLQRLADTTRKQRDVAWQAFPMLHVRRLDAGLPDTGEWRGKPVLRDLNGDGKLDLVTSIRRLDKHHIADGIRVYLGDGAGHWRLSDKGLAKDMGYGGTDAADLNGDGRPDLVYSGHDLPPRAFLNFLDYEGQDEWVALDSLTDLAGISCSDVALGDYDQDGAPDLAVMGFFPKTGGLYVLHNDGTGAFEAKQELMPLAHYGAIVRFVDIDGDGRPELLAATSLGPTVWRWTDGAWSEDREGLPSTFGVGEISGIVRGIDAVDIDGDGHAELAVSGLPNGEHKPIALYRREAGRWVSFGHGLPATESFFDVVFARLGGGVVGMFLAGQHGVLVVRCDRDGTCEVLGRIVDTEGVLNVGAGDVDGDGVDEVFAMQQSGLGMFAFDLPARTAKEGSVR